MTITTKIVSHCNPNICEYNHNITNPMTRLHFLILYKNEANISRIRAQHSSGDTKALVGEEFMEAL